MLRIEFTHVSVNYALLVLFHICLSLTEWIMFPKKVQLFTIAGYFIPLFFCFPTERNNTTK